MPTIAVLIFAPVGLRYRLGRFRTDQGKSQRGDSYLLPWIIPGVVVALIWEFIYQPNYGLLNDVLIRIGVMTERVA